MAKGMVKTKDSMHTTANVFSADMFSPGFYKANLVDEFSSFILVDYLSPHISGYVCMYVCMYIYVCVYML